MTPRVEICRRKHQDNPTKQTLGDMYGWDAQNNFVFECVTLELPYNNNKVGKSCIKPDTYLVVPRHSEKFGDHFILLDVEGRSLILIHPGNYHTEIRGCILIGESYKYIDTDGIIDIAKSGDTLKELLKTFPSGFELIIHQDQ